MKEAYIVPELEVIRFENEDLMTASNPDLYETDIVS